jgi:hypothetical protein
VNPTTLADRLRTVGLLHWGERTGLVVPCGHGVRDNPNVVTLGFVFFPLRPQ